MWREPHPVKRPRKLGMDTAPAARQRWRTSPWRTRSTRSGLLGRFLGMGGEPRMTPQTVAVLQAMLDDPARARYGRDLCRQAGLKSGTVQPILARMEQAGL